MFKRVQARWRTTELVDRVMVGWIVGMAAGLVTLLVGTSINNVPVMVFGAAAFGLSLAVFAAVIVAAVS